MKDGHLLVTQTFVMLNEVKDLHCSANARKRTKQSASATFRQTSKERPIVIHREDRQNMTTEEQLTNTAVHAWKLVVGRLDNAIAPLTDEQLQKQIAPGKNRLFYLVGHLTAVHDRLFSLLGLGERLHPELDEIYITSPDRARPDPVSAADLKHAWSEVNNKLTADFEQLTPRQWLEKHTAVSDEDFAKDPTRNRLSVLMSRTNHAAFHTGQAVLIK
jgi:uncharacterized damage-inducible protein DinB